MKNPTVVRLPDAAVEEAVKKLIQGSDENSSGEHPDHGDTNDDSQTGGEPTAEFCRKRSQRLYNWNTTHFYPDIHKVDVASVSVRQRARRHSEPDCSRFGRDFGTVDDLRASSNSFVSTASSEASSCVGDKTDDVIMPVSELSVWVSTSREQLSATQVDHHSSAFESSSDSAEGEGSRQTTVWQRNPLHVKMGKSKSAHVSSAAAAERERQTNASVRSMSSVKSDSAGKQLTLDLIDGGISQITLDRPSVRHRELTEKRREFVRQRCKSQGWDLGDDVEAELCAAREVATAKSVEKALKTPGVRLSISRSQEDIRYIEKPATEWSVKGNMENYQTNQEARIDMKNLIRNFESLTAEPNSKTKDKKKPTPVSTEAQTNGCNRNKILIKTDYERPSRMDDGRQANRSETVNKFSSSSENTNDQVKLRSDRVQSAGHRQSHYQEMRRSLIAPTGVFVSSNRYPAAERSAVLDIGSDAERYSAMTSSAPVHTATFEHRVLPQKSEKNSTAAAAEEKAVHSSNKLDSLDRVQIFEADDNNADQYSFTTTVKITSTPRKIIPPDDYEYILRKIHCDQQVSDESMAGNSPPQNSRNRSEVAVGTKQVQALNHGKQAKPVKGQSITAQSYASNDGHFAAEDETANSKLTHPPNQRTLPVNASSYRANMPAGENRRLSKPDVIPSPTITEMSSAETVEQLLTARANWLSSAPANNRDDFVPATAVEAKIRGRNVPHESKLSYSRPVSAGCKLVRTMPVEAFEKKPQLANEDWPTKIVTEDWLYNTSYEPTSYVQPSCNSPFVADRSQTQQLPERHRNNLHIRPAPPAAVQEALHHLDDDDDFPPPPTPSAFLHEQYRFSIQEPARTAQPEAIVVEQNLPLFRSVDDFKRKQVNIPADHVSQRHRPATGHPTTATTSKTTYLTDNILNGCNKSTVFSLTGYQRPRNSPPEVAVNEPAAYTDWPQMLDCSNTSSSPLYCSNALTPSDVYSSQEPIYWNSVAAKRRPIVDSREVETALHGTDGRDESSTYGSSNYQSWRAPESAVSVNSGGLEIPDVWQMFDEPVYSDSPVNRNSEPRRQHSLRDRVDLESCLQRHDRLFESSFVIDGVVNMVDRNYETAGGGGSWSPSDYRDVSVLSTKNHRHQPAAGGAATVALVGQENSVPEQTIELTQIQGDETAVREPTYFRTSSCVIQQSPASAKYEKHVVRAQEEHQAQRMGRIELPFVDELIGATATKCGSYRKSHQTNETRQYEKPSVHGETKLPDKTQYSVNRAPVQREVKSELARSDNCQDKSKISALQQQQQQHNPQQNKVGDDGDDDENCQPISVAAIKAKLFGANEELAGQLLNGRNTGSSSAPGSPVVKTVPPSVAHASTTAASKSGIPNAFTAAKSQPETRRQLPAEPLNDDTEKAHQNVNRERPISAKECKTAEDLKRLSITNVRMLESSQARSDRQGPSLTYAEEWLASSNIAILHGKPDPFLFSQTTGHIDETTICGKQTILSGGGSNPDVRFRTQCEATLTTPSTSMSSLPQRNKPEDDRTDGNPTADKMSFLSRCEVRRSLPNMTDRDIRRWQSILSKLPQEEIDAGSKETDVDKQPLSSSTDAPKAAAAESCCKAIGDVSRTAQLSASLVLTGGAKQTDEIPAVHFPPQTNNKPQTMRDVELHDEARSGSRSSPVHNAVIDEKNANDAKSATTVEKESSTNSVDVVRIRSETQSTMNDSDQEALHPVSTSAAVTEDNMSSVSTEMNSTSVISSTITTVTETSEERMKRLQKLREDWFKSDVGVSKKPHDSRLLLSSADATTTSTVVSAAQSVCTSSAALNLQAAVDGKQQKSAYVSPLMKSSSSGYVRPDVIAAAANKDGSSVQSTSAACQKGVTSDDNVRRPCDRSVTADVGGVDNVTAGSKLPLAKVCDPTTSNKTQAEQLLPTTATDDKQRVNISSDKRLYPSVVLQDCRPSFADKRDDKTRSEKRESSERYEKTVDVARQRTFQSQSQRQVIRKLEVKSDKNSTVTHCSSDMKLVQVYRTQMSDRPSPVTVQLQAMSISNQSLPSDRGAQTACIVELSDGEMTDATDVTLDAIVGENQSWRFASDAYEFSDVEFLSSANLSSKYHETRHESKRHAEVSTLMSSGSVLSSSCGQFSSKTDDVVAAKSNREAAIEAARAEMKLYRRKKEDKQPDDTPPERQRSIKELVTSFEGLVNPYLRTTRPRSMEIKFSSSSSDDEDDEIGAAPPSGGGKAKKKTQLKCSSSFKEPASTAGYRHRRQVKKLTR